MDYADILRVVGAIVLGSGAIFLAYKNIGGWGWFLFAAVLLGTTVVRV